MTTFPPRPAILRQQDATIRHGINRIAQIAILAADTVEIVAEMIVLSEPLRVVAHGTVRAAQRKIKPRRRGERGQFKWRRLLKREIDLCRSRQLGPELDQNCGEK